MQFISARRNNICARRDWEGHQQTGQQQQCSLLFIETGMSIEKKVACARLRLSQRCQELMKNLKVEVLRKQTMLGWCLLVGVFLRRCSADINLWHQLFPTDLPAKMVCSMKGNNYTSTFCCHVQIYWRDTEFVTSTFCTTSSLRTSFLAVLCRCNSRDIYDGIHWSQCNRRIHSGRLHLVSKHAPLTNYKASWLWWPSREPDSPN